MEEKVVTLELKELLSNNHIKRLILPFFDTFDSGKLDDDIQVFLKEHALDYEKSGIARTTLIFDKKRTELLGYFTIGLNTIKFNKTIKRYCGYKKVKEAYPGIDLFKHNLRPVYKLFMIGKNYNAQTDTKGFMDYCFNDLIWERIYACNSLVGTNLMYLDCENNDNLIKKYQKQGFEVYEKYEYNDETSGVIVKMVRMITNV